MTVDQRPSSSGVAMAAIVPSTTTCTIVVGSEVPLNRSCSLFTSASNAYKLNTAGSNVAVAVGVSVGTGVSVAVGVGFIALAGVAVEIGVLMLVYLNQAFIELRDKASQAKRKITRDEYIEALLQGASLRVRPVMMTVATIIIGLLPILYGTGTGSEVMSRIAAPMVGGMTSALVLTLIVLPALYGLINEYKRRGFNRDFG